MHQELSTCLVVKECSSHTCFGQISDEQWLSIVLAIGQNLVEAVEAQCDLDDGKAGASEHGSAAGGGRGGRHGSKLGEVAQPLYLVPIFELPKDVEPIHHPLFTFHPIKKPEVWPIEAD